VVVERLAAAGDLRELPFIVFAVGARPAGIAAPLDPVLAIAVGAAVGIA
jgi:hypothetical protein